MTDAVELFIEAREARNLSAETLEWYRRHLLPMIERHHSPLAAFATPDGQRAGMEIYITRLRGNLVS